MSVGCEYAIFENGIYICNKNEEPCIYKTPNAVKCKFSGRNKLTCLDCAFFVVNYCDKGCSNINRDTNAMTCSLFKQRLGNTCKYCQWFLKDESTCCYTASDVYAIDNPEKFTCGQFHYIKQYDDHIMEAIDSMLEDEDTSCLSILDVNQIFSKSEILDAVLSYDGLHGYVNTLKSIIHQIYDIELD